MSPPGEEATAQSARLDLTRAPLLGPFLRWQHARAALQWPMLLGAVVLIYDGFFGPQIAPRNVAGVAPWVQWRGLTVLALLLVGSLFCTACPFMLVRNLAKRLLPADRPWPRRLEGKWPAALLLALFFWFYETFDPWASPMLTAYLALAYFGLAFAVDGLFRGAAFCKYLCPIGQFNFVNSLSSPFEVRVRRPQVCATCATKDCIKPPKGCETWLFQPRKSGNMDCTFCLDCLHACPHDNVGVLSRVPTSELWTDPQRSSLGRFGNRPDLAALVLVMVYGSMLNAFGMVEPFYPLARGLATALGTTSEGLVLLLIAAVGLLFLPVATLGLAASASRALTRSREPLLPLATRYSFALAPLGFSMWIAHYGFHFLTGGLTLVPVLQSLLADLGFPIAGEPAWGLGPLVPASWLLPLELLSLEVGLIGTLAVAYRISRMRQNSAPRARLEMLPWALLALALFAVGVWLMLQPMEMRGTFSVG